MSKIEYPQDTVVETVLNQIKDRADVGLIKYGVPMTRTDLSASDWAGHAIEELLDAALYLTRLKMALS